MKQTKMTSLFIDRAIIEWNKIEEGSYLFDIKAIHDVEEIVFRSMFINDRERLLRQLLGENEPGRSNE